MRRAGRLGKKDANRCKEELDALEEGSMATRHSRSGKEGASGTSQATSDTSQDSQASKTSQNSHTSQAIEGMIKEGIEDKTTSPLGCESKEAKLLAPPPTRYFNREFSWLAFNTRVLEQAEDTRLPLLERLRFLSIYATNLDEFYIIRVAGLVGLYKQDIVLSPLSAAAQIEHITNYLQREKTKVEGIYYSMMCDFKEEGIEIIDDIKELTALELRAANAYFDEHIYPLITPIIIGEKFPHLSSLTNGLCSLIKDSDTGEIAHALVTIPSNAPRFYNLPLCLHNTKEIDQDKKSKRFILIEEIIASRLGHLYEGYEILGVIGYRVSRDTDIEIEQIEAEDFLEFLSQSLKMRKFNDFIRLEINGLERGNFSINSSLVTYLQKRTDIRPRHTYAYTIPLDLGAFLQLLKAKILHGYARAPAKSLRKYEGKDSFLLAQSEDILLYQPYESFGPVRDLIINAASDPATLAIKMTLYRAGSNSPIVDALIEAARCVQVTIIVELRARFDEENNIHWARALELAGANVIYGVKDYKVHAKAALVVKEIDGKVMQAAHISSGNYNVNTARGYTDVSLITSHKSVISDVAMFFNTLTIANLKRLHLKTLFTSPIYIERQLLSCIRREMKYGAEGEIILKANSLIDEGIIEALYEASRAGVQIRLIIRGICTLRPGVRGMSENIEVVSILGRFLEHARIYYFRHDSVYFSSADLMPRNLNRRVELLVPMNGKEERAKLLSILTTSRQDTISYTLQGDGEYVVER